MAWVVRKGDRYRNFTFSFKSSWASKSQFQTRQEDCQLDEAPGLPDVAQGRDLHGNEFQNSCSFVCLFWRSITMVISSDFGVSIETFSFGVLFRTTASSSRRLFVGKVAFSAVVFEKIFPIGRAKAPFIFWIRKPTVQFWEKLAFCNVFSLTDYWSY